MMIEDRFFDQQWIQELSNEDFRMLMYLMHFATKKCGIIELNMRMLNFAANTGKMYTKKEVLERFSNMLCMIPGKSNTAIFPNWIATNWAKGGKPIDADRNPLFKSVVAELAAYGLTIDSLNQMAKVQISLKQGEVNVAGNDNNNTNNHKSANGRLIATGFLRSEEKCNLSEMFESFWKEYPGPRKVDKKKCRDKFVSAVEKSAKGRTVDEAFGEIMNGLAAWKKCSTWNKDGGQFIRAPLVWLNNENWKDIPDGCQEASAANAELSKRSSSIMDRLRKDGLA